MSEARCQCGDKQSDHQDGTGECIICFWLPSTPGQPCQEFRPVEEEGAS